MKTIVFTDGSKLNVEDESTVTLLRMTVDSFKDVDSISANFTNENMKSVTFDGTLFSEVIPEKISAITDEDIVKVSIQNRMKTFEEKTNEILLEQADALMELAEAV